MPAKEARNMPAQNAEPRPEAENPYLNARSLDDLRQMEAQLYRDTWQDGKIRPNLEEHYTHQMELFLEACAALFPEQFDFHQTTRKP